MSNRFKEPPQRAERIPRALQLERRGAFFLSLPSGSRDFVSTSRRPSTSQAQSSRRATRLACRTITRLVHAARAARARGEASILCYVTFARASRDPRNYKARRVHSDRIHSMKSGCTVVLSEGDGVSQRSSDFRRLSSLGRPSARLFIASRPRLVDTSP